MSRITRYIFRQLALVTVFVALTVTAAVWLAQSLRFVEMIVNRGLSLGMFLSLTSLLVPSLLAVVLPIAAFIAVAFTYHRLVMESELVVLRATGCSQFALARPALLLALVVTAAGYLLNLYLLPVSYRSFKEFEAVIRNEFSIVLLQEGTFTNLNDDVTLYVRARQNDGTLQGILVQDNRNPAKPVTMMAERGALIAPGGAARIVMFNGNRQEVERQTGQLSLLHFDTYAIDINRLENVAEARWREPRERFLPDLLQPDDSPNDRDHYTKLVAEGHYRIVSPLYALCFVVIALASLLGGQSTRRNAIGRISAAVMAVVVLQSAGLGLKEASGKSLAIVPLIYAVPIVALMAASYGVFAFGRLWRRRRTAGLAAIGG